MAITTVLTIMVITMAAPHQGRVVGVQFASADDCARAAMMIDMRAVEMVQCIETSAPSTSPRPRARPAAQEPKP